MTKYKWIVLKFDEKPNRMICQRCGASATAPMPCRLEDAEKLMHTFTEIHKKCRNEKQGEQG